MRVLTKLVAAGMLGAFLATSLVASPALAAKVAPKHVAHKKVAAVYTCPMHPEVVSKTKGQCPKCGMNLVLKTPTKK